MKPAGPPITPAGMAALRARYDHLLGTERPAIVEVVSWAAGNGDRSENGDYLYGRKRMREIDRELAFLARRMKALRVVDLDVCGEHEDRDVRMLLADHPRGLEPGDGLARRHPHVDDDQIGFARADQLVAE